MTVNGINSASQLAILLQQVQQTAQQSTATQSSSSSSSSALNASSAYSLTTGQSKSQASLLGYSSLGKLINQAGQALATMDQTNPAVRATLGDGSTMQQTYAVNVTRLAQAQVSTSQSFASDSQSLVGTGTLTIQAGNYAADGSFTASRSAISLKITDGSLNGVASAINTANVGLTATVVKADDGSFKLQVAGQSGADAGFQLGGLDSLTSKLTLTKAATDAQFTVDGGAAQTSPTNTGVSIGQGATANLTATGAMTVSVPFGLAQANGAAQTLVSSVNALFNSLSQLTGTSGQLAGDTGVAGSLNKALSKALTSSGGSDLAAIGITTNKDGTLSLDPAALQKAYTSDPTGTRAVLDKVSNAVQDMLSGSGGTTTQIRSQMKTLATSLTQTTSLLDYLNGSSSSQDSSSLQSLLSGGESLASTLTTALGASSASSSSSISALLAQLQGTSASSSSTMSDLLAQLQGTSASSSSTMSDLLAQLQGTSASSSSSSSISALLAALSQSSASASA